MIATNFFNDCDRLIMESAKSTQPITAFSDKAEIVEDDFIDPEDDDFIDFDESTPTTSEHSREPAKFSVAGIHSVKITINSNAVSFENLNVTDAMTYWLHNNFGYTNEPLCEFWNGLFHTTFSTIEEVMKDYLLIRYAVQFTEDVDYPALTDLQLRRLGPSISELSNEVFQELLALPIEVDHYAYQIMRAVVSSDIATKAVTKITLTELKKYASSDFALYKYICLIADD